MIIQKRKNFMPFGAVSYFIIRGRRMNLGEKCEITKQKKLKKRKNSSETMKIFVLMQQSPLKVTPEAPCFR